MRALRWAALASLVAGACTSLNMMPPETGTAGAGGATAGASGAGVAGTGGAAGGGGANAGAGGASAGTGGGRGGSGGTTLEPAGLIAYWRFNEGNGTTVADSSGNGQSLTISSNNGWTTFGHQDDAFAFDGASDVASVMPQQGQPLLAYPTVPLTFLAWIRPASSAAARPFATAVARSHEDYAFQDFWLGLVDGKPGCTIHSPDKQGPVASAVAPANAWTHIACTYGLSGTATLYVNGAYTASISTDQLLGPIPTAILVGASETADLEDHFTGAIDDVRVYNTTLTATEVMSIAR